MSKLTSISPQTHKDLRWRRPSNFLFAGGDNLMPLGLQEMRKAAMGLPAGFVKLQDGYVLIAIMSLRNGENLVVDSAGKWLANHLPDGYLGFPFQMSRLDQERFQVCVQDESEFVLKAEEVPEEAKGWRRFFDEEGELADGLPGLVSLLQKHASDLAAAERATAKLTELELIKEWEISVGDKESPVLVKGLHTIDQERLGKLEGDELAAMRDCGALYLAYSQQLSGHHLPALIHFAQRRWKTPEGDELDFGETIESGNISFDNL